MQRFDLDIFVSRQAAGPAVRQSLIIFSKMVEYAGKVAVTVENKQVPRSTFEWNGAGTLWNEL